jgi:hypothetical protein
MHVAGTVINTDYVRVYDDTLIVPKEHVKFFNILIFSSLMQQKQFMAAHI